MAASQHPVELIMARGFTANLVTAAFLVDEAGTLIFFNEAAGDLLGISFEEAGPMSPEEWGGRFAPMSIEGRDLAVEDLPLSIALNDGRPAHRRLRIRAADGEVRDIEVSAFPIVGESGPHGAMAIFWERPD
jgi:PAS domain S-box-containing protein